MNAIRTRVAAALIALGAASILPAGGVLAAAPTFDGATAQHARHHRGPERMFAKLGLSADQQASVDAILAAKGPALKTLHEQMRANMDKLRQTKPDDPNFSAAVSQAAQANGSLTTQAISAQGEMQAQLYAVLTPAQKTQLAALQAKQGERMKKGGRHWGHRAPMGDDQPGEAPSEDAPPVQ